MSPAPGRAGRVRLARAARRAPGIAAVAAATLVVPAVAGQPGASGTQHARASGTQYAGGSGGQRGPGHPAARRPVPASARSAGRVGLAVAGWGEVTSGPTVPLAGAGTVSFDLELRPRHEAALAALIAAQRDPSSPSYHRWLTPASYEARFGPSAAEASAVSSWASSQGLSSVRHGDELVLAGPAPRVGRALRTTLVAHLAGVATTSAPSLPAGVHGDVAAAWSPDAPAPVPLLSPGTARRSSDLEPARPPAAEAGAPSPATSHAGRASALRAAARPAAQRLRAQTGGPTQSCAAASSDGPAFTDVGDHYGIGTLQSDGDLGQGETIGLFELAGFSMGDIDTFEACLGVHTVVTALQVGVGDPVGNLPIGGLDSVEAALDVEAAIAQAPDARIVVYEGVTDYPIYQAIVQGVTVNGSSVEVAPDGFLPQASLDVGEQFPPPPVVSTSWGWLWEDDPTTTASIQESLDPLFEQGASEGESIFAASGDEGGGGGIAYPADSPWVTGVGGTDVNTSGPEASWPPDTAWPYSTGGFSPVETEPTWQLPVEQQDADRGVPDVAADAEAYSVYASAPPAPDVTDLGGGTVALSDSAADQPCSLTVPASNAASCSFPVPAAGNTATVAYTPAGATGAESTMTVDGDGAASTVLELVFSPGSDTLWAQVTRPVDTNTSTSTNPLDYGVPGPLGFAGSYGTVTFTDTAAKIGAGCTSVPVLAGGLAGCANVDLLAAAAAGDTITATYTPDAADGASSASLVLPAGSSPSLPTSLQVGIEQNGPLHEWYLQPAEVEAATDNWPWAQVGGTSAAAPLWAALTADVDDTCTTAVGDLAPELDALYETAGTSLYGVALTDVTAGSNGSPFYSASAGWDPVTGLGTPVATGLACPQLATISEPTGNAGDTVTLTGSNLSLADFTFGGTAARVLSRTAASVTVVVPAGSSQVAVRAATPLGAGPGLVFDYAAASTTTTAPAQASSPGGSGGSSGSPAAPATTTSSSTTTTTPPTTTSLPTVHQVRTNPDSVSTSDGQVTVDFLDTRAPGKRATIVLWSHGRKIAARHVRLGGNGRVRWVSPALRPGTYIVSLVVHGRVVHRTVIHASKQAG